MLPFFLALQSKQCSSLALVLLGEVQLKRRNGEAEHTGVMPKGCPRFVISAPQHYTTVVGG